MLATLLVLFQGLQARSIVANDHVVIEIEQRTPELACALRRAQVVELVPVFPRPPRGWCDEAAARAAGLERFFLARFENPLGDDALVERIALDLSRAPGVRSCQASRGGELGQVPNDPDFPSQWQIQPGLVDAPTAWDFATTSDRIVAVIDSGADLAHPELAGNLWTNPGEIPANGVDDDGNGHVDDVHGWDFADDDSDPTDELGHGTRVSGVIGAIGNNGIENAGICWQVPLMELRMCCFGTTPQPDDVAQAVTYAADMGASIMQITWGFKYEPAVLRAAMDYAVALGLLPIAIASNQANDEEHWPAAWDDVIGVISTDVNDQRAATSCWGDWNDLSAPGEDVYLITFPFHKRTGSGTSFASPHVSGSAALIQAINPDLDAEATRLVLQNSAKDLGAPGFDADYAWGRLDVGAAAKLALTLKAAPTQAQPGDDVTITVDTPALPNALHAVFVTRFGRRPGLPLAAYDPADVRVLPVNYDALLFPIVLGEIGGGDLIFERFIECTDGQGRSAATMHVPRGPVLLGADLDFAAIVLDPLDLSKVSASTCNARVSIR